MAEPTPPTEKFGAPGLSAEFEAKLRMARAAVNALDRAIRTRKLYAPSHPLHQEASADILPRFSEFFARYHYMRLEVTPRELRMEGRALIACEPRESEIPFRLYKDGIRELRFNSGLTHEEIHSFLWILELDPHDIRERDEDLVSLMWSRDLKSIDFVAVDELDISEADPAADPDLRRRAAEIRQGIEQSVQATTSEACGVAAPAPPAPGPAPSAPPRESRPLSPEQIGAILGAPTDELVASLRDEVESETLEAAIRRCLDLLIRLFHEAKTVTSAEVAPLLRGVAGSYARKGDFAGVGHLMHRLKQGRFLDTLEGGAGLWRQLMEDVCAPDVRRGLLGYLNGPYSGDQEGLKRYLDLGGPAFVPDLCEIYGKVGSAAVRAILRDIIIRYGRLMPESFKTLLKNADHLLPEALEIVRAVKPPRLNLHEVLPMDRLTSTVRAQVVSVSTSLETSTRSFVLRRGVTDEDSSVRVQALNAMAESNDVAFSSVVHQWIEDKNFINRDLKEKIAAYRAFARLGGSVAVSYFKELLDRRPPIFNRQKAVESRYAAVFGLQAAGTPAALEILRALAAGGDPTLQQAAQEALKTK